MSGNRQVNVSVNEITEVVQIYIEERGLSAYQVALQNGFVGSELDWLASLKGEEGDDANDLIKLVDSYAEMVSEAGGIKPKFIAVGVDESKGLDDTLYLYLPGRGRFLIPTEKDQ